MAAPRLLRLVAIGGAQSPENLIPDPEAAENLTPKVAAAIMGRFLR